MKKFTNIHNISLPFAIMLATDNYDMVPAENKISVTTLMRSTRQVILAKRIEGSGGQLEDISNLVSSGIGTAIHGGMEKALLTPQQALLDLGYPQKVVDRIKVNPTEVEPDDLPLWTELRTEKLHNGLVVSGCADLIFQDRVQDLKTTGIFAWTSGSNFGKYQLQLSIYRWLNPDKVTDPTGLIHYFFRDWSKLEAGYKSNYPKQPMMTQEIPLLTLRDTEKYVTDKIDLLVQYADTPEVDLPQCSSEDLWQGLPKWQYFGSRTAKKASKNFDTEHEALTWRNTKGKGEVRYKPSLAKACNYCTAKPKCSQAQELIRKGLLKE